LEVGEWVSEALDWVQRFFSIQTTDKQFTPMNVGFCSK